MLRPTLPKNVIVGLHPSRRTHRQQRFGGLLFQCLCVQEPERGELSKQRKQWISLAQKQKSIFMQDRRRFLYCSQQQPRRHGRSSDRRIRPRKKLPSSCLKTPVTPEFKNGITLAYKLVWSETPFIVRQLSVPPFTFFISLVGYSWLINS